MALNTRKLLQSLGIARVTIIGHSMGGMLAARFAASYPDMAERAVIYDPDRTHRPPLRTPLAHRRRRLQSHDGA